MIEKSIPTGIFQIQLIVAGKHFEDFKKSRIFNTCTNPQDIFVVECSEPTKSYFEAHIEEANIGHLIEDLMEMGVVADLDVLPLDEGVEYFPEQYNITVPFNAYVRQTPTGEMESYINSKQDEDIAYEMHITMMELNEKGIHEADLYLLQKIHEFHSVGWVCM